MYTLFRFLPTCLLFILIQVARGQEEQVKYVESAIKKVTVFTGGAQLTREADVQIEKGITQLIFKQISPSVNPQSIQLGGTSGLTLLSVIHRENPIMDRENADDYKQLKDSIIRIQFLIDQLGNSKFVTDQEIELILANKRTGGEKGTDMAAFEEMQEVYRKKLPALKDEQLRLRMQEEKLMERIQKMKQKLDELYNSNGQSVHEIVATVKSETSKKVKLELSYFSYAASWTPTYDVRCKDLNTPLQLIYKAHITQSTGENWNKVMLKISAGNPVLNGTKPDIQPVYLGWNEYVNARKMNAGKAYESAPAPAVYGNTLKAGNDPNYTNEPSDMSNGPLNVEFSVAVPYTILSNNKPVMVDVQTFELPATFTLYSAPKMDKSAFLMASVSSANEISQLNGMAHVYFDGAYAGQSAVQSDENDTMKISMGRDKSIIVDRKNIKSKSSRAVLGSKKTESNEYEISIRNTRNSPVTIIVEDQIPVSSDKDIEVEKGELSGAILEEATGKLTWTLTLSPGETKKFHFGFQVKYPKNRRINAY